MRAASTIFAAVFVTILSCRVGFSQTACLEETRQDSVLRAVRERSSLATGLTLRAAMIPRLTDTVIILKTEHMQDPINAQVPVFAFYAVRPAFFKLEGSRVASVTVELDDESE
jgi:hypothetical protein